MARIKASKKMTAQRNVPASAAARVRNRPAAALPAVGPAADAAAPNAAYRTTAQLDGGTTNNPTVVEVISPDVPDQTGYSGRNYIDLGLAKDKFIPEISVDRSGHIIDFANVSAALLSGGAAVAADARAGAATASARDAALRLALLGTGNAGSGGTTTLTLDLPTSAFNVSTATANIPVLCRASPIDAGGEQIATNPGHYLSIAVDGTAVGGITATYTPPPKPNPEGEHGYVEFDCTATVAATANKQTHTLTATPINWNPLATSLSFTVQGPPAGGGGPFTAVAQLTVAKPPNGAVIGTLPADPNTPQPYLVQFSGSASVTGGPNVAGVDIVINGDSSTKVSASPDLNMGWASWTASVLVPQYGPFQAAVTLNTSDPQVSTTQTLQYVLAPSSPRLWLYSRLMIVEEFRLTNFIGRAGPGRVLRTMSLLPGETSTITVKTFLSENYSASDTSSIFDHVDTSTSSDFDTSIGDEQSSKSEHKDSLGSRTTTTTNEQAIQRELKNINVSRTLNFLFSQLNQEYLSILHLVDVRIGYAAVFLDLMTGNTYSPYREVPLSQMDTLGTQVVREWPPVSVRIVDILQNVADYNDNVTSVIEKKAALGNYWRFRHNLTQAWADPTGVQAPAVEGLVISGSRVIMRTEGVLVEALLGQNPALDDYSAGLQAQALREKTIANDAAQQVIDLINTPVAAQTDAWQKTHPCCQPATLSIAAVPPPAAAAGGGGGA